MYIKNIFKVFSCLVKWYTKGVYIYISLYIEVFVLKVSSRYTKGIFKVRSMIYQR